MTYDERMADILRQDEARRLKQDLADMAKLGLSGTDYCHSRNITGEPSEKNRQYRASDDSWKRGLSRTKTIGTADGKTQSVKVTRHGQSEIYPTRGFRIRKGTRTVINGNLRYSKVMANDPRFGNKA